MPEKYLEKTLADIPEGSPPVYVTYWALHVDADLGCWIDVHHAYHLCPHGTSGMRVARVAGGFKVWLTSAKYNHGAPASSMTERDGFLPVVAFGGEHFTSE